MKITLQQIKDGREEVIIKYKQMTEHIEGIVRYVEGQSEKLFGSKDGQECMLPIPDIIYLESVDGITYIYTEEGVYKGNLTLALAEVMYAEEGFVRCSKSMVINMYHIQKLKSMSGNRIDVTMDNGEHVIVSRRYAKEIRCILKEEGR